MNKQPSNPLSAGFGFPGLTGSGFEGFLQDVRESDLFALWSEITLDDPRQVSTPVAKRIQAAWRNTEGADFGHRMMTVITAAESECPGLWLDIAGAAVRRLEAQDHAFQASVREDIAKAEELQSEVMRSHRRKQLSAKVHAYHSRISQPSPPNAR